MNRNGGIILVALAVLDFGARQMFAQSSHTNAVASESSSSRPAREDTYTITSVMQILNPVRPADMTDDFQDVRVVSQDKDSATLEITYYPLYRPVIGENPNWRRDDAAMTEFLKPGPAANWNAAMQRDLLAELHTANIDPDQLTDRELVRQVSRWAMKRARSTNVFAIWCIYFPDGEPAVFPALRPAFDHQKPDGTWTDSRMLDHEVLGRSLFYNKVHGSCTSSAVYLSTIFRALGIPTRIVVCIPPFDPNDDEQAKNFYAGIHHHSVRETVHAGLDGLSGFDNHVFNEVYIDHRWVRLNYSNLGQPILDAHYFGLLTHIYTCSDLSDVPLASTWGMRYFNYPADQPKLSSVNPYRLISVEDRFGANARVDNPTVQLAELQTVTIVGLYPPDSSAVPRWVDKTSLQRSKVDFLIAIREWVPGGYNQMRAFERRVGHDFVLIAPGHDDINVQLSGLKLSAGDGSFQAFGARILADDRVKLERGVSYSIRPINRSDTYRWQMANDLAPFRWAN
jgi:hypothetical protein